MKKRIAVLGASGYTGREVLRLVSRHPQMEVAAAMSARVGAEPEPPELPFDGPIEALDHDRLADCDGVFLCTPHGAAAMHARAALERGCKVVDLSADFRLRDPAVHASTYGEDHGPDLRDRAVYGLPEFHRAEVAAADLIANPGCYPTSVSLPLRPLIERGLIDLGADVVADCKSGASGAGKTPQPRTVFGSVHENFLAYGVGTHRHQPEIWQTLGTDRVLFVPHLLPVFRGILATIWARPASGVDAASIRTALVETYADEPFVRVYERGMPELNRVQMTNFCDIGVADVHGRVVLVSVIDNLVKGAAGQALQNMNLVLGLPETEGLLS
ncbi:MAG: N-acetyl-gamma-glutamyl-phosphate reductase [Planctomycetota bacterium]|nr:N-acetyl-gamma-glutamyl-phosphate reductase [Planctomycetota bacterium]MDA1223176.1 N-acetyl-gamma-glutamyl-phosphate reductase [Planctomycetota bacterium]